MRSLIRLLSILCLCFCFGLAAAGSAQAEGVSVQRAQATVTGSGQLNINTRFSTQLPDQLKQALLQGVPLNFDLSYQLTSPTWPAYRNRIGSLLSNDNLIRYRLSYHPLTGRYRVSMGTFSTEYNSLDTALKAIGSVANWKVLSSGTLKGVPVSDISAEVRLSLSISELPRPFQINAITSRVWQVDSGWRRLSIGG